MELVPETSEVDHSIEIFSGVQVSHVFHKKVSDDGEECYKVVGDAFVQGTMHGEAFESNVDVHKRVRK